MKEIKITYQVISRKAIKKVVQLARRVREGEEDTKK